MQIYCKIRTLPRSKICMLSQNVMGCGSEEITVSQCRAPEARSPAPRTAGHSRDEQRTQSEGSAARPAAAGCGKKVQRCPAAAQPLSERDLSPSNLSVYIVEF